MGSLKSLHYLVINHFPRFLKILKDGMLFNIILGVAGKSWPVCFLPAWHDRQRLMNKMKPNE